MTKRDLNRDVVRRFSVSAVKRRGRPRNSRGRDDFALEEVDARYPALLRKHEEEAQERKRLAAAEGTIQIDFQKVDGLPNSLRFRQRIKGFGSDA